LALVIYTPEAVADFERLAAFAVENDAELAPRLVRQMEEAIGLLKDHPLLGRSVNSGLRQLVLSRGRTGYLALYRYDIAADRVLVARLQHQREAGYADPDDPI
jgi:plasmid stabilization system protein ParE